MLPPLILSGGYYAALRAGAALAGAAISMRHSIAGARTALLVRYPGELESHPDAAERAEEREIVAVP
jgi:hypothetical protein